MALLVIINKSMSNLNIMKPNLKKEDLIKYVRSKYPLDKARIISDILKDVIVIKNDKIYCLNEHTYYSVVEYSIGTLQTIIMTLLTESSKCIESVELKHLERDLKEENINYYSNFKNSSIMEILPQVKDMLTDNKIEFDSYINQIHFINGYVDLLTGELKTREKNKHRISKVINRDYIKSDESDKNTILKYISQILPTDCDRKTILMTIGSALSGQSTKSQDLLILVGEGSAGKSFILTLLESVIPCYFKELKDDTFSKNNSKIDKIINSYCSNPQYRITWINEPKDTRSDESFFKNFCDGRLQTTKLYEEGSHDVCHFSKPILTMNNMLNIKADSGTTRRMKGYEHKSKFVDKVEDVDEANHIYLKDESLLEKIKQNDKLLNAFFDILSEHCKNWLRGEKIQYSTSFIDTKNSIVCANDHIQDFIDGHLLITGSSQDRIGKVEMKEAYDTAYKHKMMSLQQIISELKSHGVKYNCDWRVNNVKGCFYNIKFRKHQDDSDDDYDNGVDKSDKSINGNMIMHAELLQLKKENEYLKLYQVFSKAKEMKSTFMRINDMNKTANALFEVIDNPPHDMTDLFFNKFY